MIFDKDFCHLRLGFDTLIQDFLSSKVLNKHLPKMKLTSEGKIIGSIYSSVSRNNPTLHLRVYNRDRRRTVEIVISNYLDVLTSPLDAYILDAKVCLFDLNNEIKAISHFDVSSTGKIVDFVDFLDFMKYNYIQQLLLRYLYDLYPSLKDM